MCLAGILAWLTYRGLLKPYDEIDLGQHWLREWLGPWWHQAIPEPMLTSHQLGFYGIMWQIFQ